MTEELVICSDGRERHTRRKDSGSIVYGAVFGPLQDLATFNAVQLDQEIGMLTWSNGADFDPATIHDWPEVCDELAERAQGWTDSIPDERRANPRMEPTRP